MSHLLDEIQRDQANESAQQGLFAGTIAENATLVTDLLPVLVDGWDTTLQLGPCRWMPRVEPTVVNVAEGAETAHNVTVATVVMPARGDYCRVGFDDQGRPVIVCWWPAGWGDA